MNPHLLPALDRLGERSIRVGFATWELRAALRWTAQEGTALAIDGGWRTERRGRAPSWRFAVGAGPAARIAALGGVPTRRDLDPDGWTAACVAIEAELRAALRSLRKTALPLTARLDEIRGTRDPLKVETFGRWRAFRGASARPTWAEERGVRVVLIGVPPDGLALEWCGAAGARPPWLEGPRWLDDRLPFRGPRATRRSGRRGGAVRRDRVPAGAGPLVLMPGAAAWWVHEMGHAALEAAEGIGRARAEHRLTIVDDPAAGPWPAGFDIDDIGEGASPAELWTEAGPSRPADDGRRRRASVREPARGALSVTRLVERGARPLAWGDLPDGTPVARGVRAGRFDPAAAAILLDLEGVGTVEGGVPVPGNGRWTALVGAGAGWKGARLLACEVPGEEGLAVCTRQGTALPVIVGAPTVVLEPVQLGR